MDMLPEEPGLDPASLDPTFRQARMASLRQRMRSCEARCWSPASSGPRRMIARAS